MNFNDAACEREVELECLQTRVEIKEETILMTSNRVVGNR